MASAIVELIVHVPIHWARRLKNVLVASLVSWIDHRAASKGAALAFYTLFSMTPILVLAIAVAAYFFGAEAAQGEIVAQLEGLVGPNGAKAMQALLAGAQSHSSGLLATLIASVLLLLGATSVFAELKGSLDELWGISPTGRSGFGVLLRTRLLSFGLVLVLAFLLLVSLVVSAGLAMAERYAHGMLGSSALVLETMSSLVSFAVIACMFSIIYKTLPDAPLSARSSRGTTPCGSAACSRSGCAWRKAAPLPRGPGSTDETTTYSYVRPYAPWPRKRNGRCCRKPG